MPSAEQAYEDLELDRGKREAEIRLIERYFNAAGSEDERSMLARSLVLLTYAHLEGFTRFALTAYAAVINSLKIPCQDAALPLVAATLNRVFAALRDVNSKHDLFRDLPGDHEVQYQARHQTFIENYGVVMAKVVDIHDSAIETGANLNARMLKRALFRMGLNTEPMDEHRDTLNKLLGERNAISHGATLKSPTPAEIEAYLGASFKIMQFIQGEVFSALNSGAYYRTAANGT